MVTCAFAWKMLSLTVANDNAAKSCHATKLCLETCAIGLVSPEITRHRIDQFPPIVISRAIPNTKPRFQQVSDRKLLTTVHGVTKCTGLKSGKPSMSNHFPVSIDPSYVSSAICRKCCRKQWRTKSIRLQTTPLGKRPKVCPRTRWGDYISDLAWSRPVVEPAELSDISVDSEVFWVLLGLPPLRLSVEEKRARKWENEWGVGLHWTFLFMKLSFVCLPNLNVVFK